MSTQPNDWNVVVVGAWNRAIFTPAWIAKELFGLAPETPIDVQVPMDALGPLRVIHAALVVTPTSGQLVVTPQEPSADALIRAASLASKSVDLLPQTPLRAAGVNIRYRVEHPSGPLIALLRSDLDDRLADAEHVVLASELQRTLRWGDGFLNIELRLHEDSTASLLLNFHRQSSNAQDVMAWLQSVDKMLPVASALLRGVFDLAESEVRQ